MKRIRTSPLLLSISGLIASASAFFAVPLLSVAGSVDTGNIKTFVDGQPALAGEVNGNFQELITQIDDNDGRITNIEGFAGSILTTGTSDVAVDCDIDGGGALQSAIDVASNHTSTLNITANGACDGPINISNRAQVFISGGGTTTITGDGTSGTTFNIAKSGVTLLGLTIDGNGDTDGLAVTNGALAVIIGVTVDGATRRQVTAGGSAQIVFGGANTVGSNADGATGLDLQSAEAYLVSATNITVGNLAINSSGLGMSLENSLFKALELVPGTTTLTIPNATEIAFEKNSVGVLSQSAIVVSDRFSVRDNSTVTVENFDAAQTFSINGKLLLDRGGIFRFDLEPAPSDVVAVHTGDLEIGLNSVFEAFGSDGNPGTLGVAVGGAVQVAVNSTFLSNSATIGATSFTSLNASVIFADNTSFSAGQPVIISNYDGTVFDVDSVDGALTGVISACATGGTAYGLDPNNIDLCP